MIDHKLILVLDTNGQIIAERERERGKVNCKV